MIGRIVACLSLCALAACVSGREERIVCDRVLTFGEEPSPSIPDRIRRVDFLPLEFSEAAAFRRADKLLFRNGLIYVGDFGSRKIVAYDMAGRVSFVIHRHGRGPGEYLEMKSFTADDRNVYVVDNASRRVLLYDCRTGVFRESKPLPVVAWDIEALHNGDFILAFSPLTGGTLSESQPNYRLFVTDSDFAVKRRLFAFDSGYSEPLAGRPIFRYPATASFSARSGSTDSRCSTAAMPSGSAMWPSTSLAGFPESTARIGMPCSTGRIGIRLPFPYFAAITWRSMSAAANTWTPTCSILRPTPLSAIRRRVRISFRPSPCSRGVSWLFCRAVRMRISLRRGFRALRMPSNGI